MAIIAVGHAITDLFFEVDFQLLENLDLDPGKMTLIDAQTSDSVLSHLDLITCTSGGSAANTAVGVTSLGASAYFIGTVGDDDFGRAYQSDLENAGVIFAGNIAKKSAEVTGHCIVFVTPDGQRTMLTHLGASIEVATTFSQVEHGDPNEIIYLEGYLLDSPGGTQTIGHLASRNRLGRLIAMSLSDSGVVARHKNELWDLLASKGISILFGNADEYLELTGTDDVYAAMNAVRNYVQQGAITLGKEGSIVFDQHEIKAIDVVKTNVVDTTGAGDLYAAGYLYALENGSTLFDCGTLGSLCAAEVISHLGARPLINLKELIAENLQS